ncbi:MAG TPA: hypothetical protein PKG48_09985, partial [Bacteroidales bacterium]|nr:hypothetical protein [Bacteroidales bacterium]
MKKILLLLSCFLTAFASFAQDHPIPQRSLLIEADTFPVVFTQVAMVDTVALLADIQHLQDFGTRNCIKPGGVQAQNWISDRMQSLGLSVEVQNFPMGGYDASDNVIGTLTGWVNPDEYVVIGG